MTRLILRLDMRAPEFGTPAPELYATALEMAEWAEAQGFAEFMLSEHHGSLDGYLPSPLILAAGLAARTKTMRIRISALVLPLHDPLRIAEDVAVLDNLSGGRIELVLAAGFLPSEFEMFGRERDQRGDLLELGIKTLEQAWSGEPFEYQGRKVQVTPRPVQRPRPPILLGGASPLAARRAARLADGYIPASAESWPAYLEECKRLGRDPGEARNVGSFALFVAEDPEALWSKIGPHAIHESNSYARWYLEGSTSGPYQAFDNIDDLRASGLYQVLTPDECVSLAEGLGPDGWLYIHPLIGGLDPSVAWESLELLAREVLPRLPM